MRSGFLQQLKRSGYFDYMKSPSLFLAALDFSPLTRKPSFSVQAPCQSYLSPSR